MAVSLSYNLVIISANSTDYNSGGGSSGGIAPIIIFVIVICSLLGVLFIILFTIFMIRVCKIKRKPLITNKNDIQFKGKNRVFGGNVQISEENMKLPEELNPSGLISSVKLSS